MKLWEVYDDSYRIRNLDDPSPLSAILMSEQEDPYQIVGYEKYLLEYLKNDICGKYGLSYDEWMQRPHCEKEIMIEVLAKHMEPIQDAMGKELKNVQQEMNSLNKMIGG